MTSKRFHLLLLGIISLLFVGLIAGAYEVNSLVSSESQKLSSLKAKDQALTQQQAGLKMAKKSLAQYSELQQIASAIVPEDKSQAETVRQLSNIASSNGIKLASITFPASTLGAVSAGAATASGSATAAPPAPSAASTKTSQLTPVKTIPGVYQLPIVVTSDSQNTAPYPRFISFLTDLENNRRTAQVTNISIIPDQNNRGNVSFIITLNEYIKP
jgi:cell division protein FtsL